MCHTCQSYTSPEAHKKLLLLRRNLQHVYEFAQSALNGVLVMEDSYRESGVRYHQTELATRQPCYFNTETLQRLKYAFESDYQVIFACFDNLIPQLTSFNANAIACEKSHECLTKRSHCCYEQILPMYAVVKKEYTQEVVQLAKVCEDANDLHWINEGLVYADVDNDGEAPWHWHQALRRAPDVIPSAAEWPLFVSWLAGLPETRRALSRRSLFSIAKNMLGRGGDVHEDTKNMPLPRENRYPLD